MLQLSHHLPPARCFLLRRIATSKQRSRARVTQRTYTLPPHLTVSAIPTPVEIDGRACMRACTNATCVYNSTHTHTHTHTENGRHLPTQLVLQRLPKGSVPAVLHASMLFSSHPPTPTRGHTHSVSHLPLKFPRLLAQARNVGVGGCGSSAYRWHRRRYTLIFGEPRRHIPFEPLRCACSAHKHARTGNT